MVIEWAHARDHPKASRWPVAGLLPRLSGSSSTLLSLFVLTSLLVALHLTGSWDQRALLAVATLRHPALTDVMRKLSEIGSWRWEVPAALGIAGLLWWRQHGGVAWRFLALGLSVEILQFLTKWMFHRSRPTVVTHLSEARWYSYPSGHATLAPIIWGFGLILVAQLVNSRPAKVVLWASAVAIPLGIAISRLYLGVHYPSDVLGALCLGLGWALYWRDSVSIRS